MIEGGWPTVGRATSGQVILGDIRMVTEREAGEQASEQCSSLVSALVPAFAFLSYRL